MTTMRPYTALVLPDVRKYLADGNTKLLRAITDDLLPPDLADLYTRLDPQQGVLLLTQLSVRTATDVLENLGPELQTKTIENIGRPRLMAMLGDMNPDDRVDLLKRLPESTVEHLLPMLAQAERDDVKRLLQYPEETAGAIMTTEYVWLKKHLTADDALKTLRKVAPDSETVYYVFVVDDDRRLEGVVSLKEIICAPPGRALADLMTEHPVAVQLGDDQEAIAKVFERYDLPTIPVLDDNGRIVGIVTFDDVMDVLADEATEDVQMLGAVDPLDIAYRDATIGHLVKKRVGWLALLLLAQHATAAAHTFFRDAVLGLSLYGAMNVFGPMVNSSGGNAGSQSATLITRALATGEVTLKDVSRVLIKEILSGLALGAILGVVGALGMLVWGQSAGVLLVLSVGVAVVVTVGALLGTITPLFFHWVGIDPAVASAPLIASVSDVVGITIYFALTYWVLG